MNWLYDVFEWTWHLSSVGDIIWRIFVVLMMMLHLFCLLFLISADDEESNTTWWKSFLFMTSIFFLPEIIIFTVGVTGYLISSI